MIKELLIPHKESILDISKYQENTKDRILSIHLEGAGTLSFQRHDINSLNRGGVLEMYLTFDKDVGPTNETHFILKDDKKRFYIPYEFTVTDSWESFEKTARIFLKYLDKYLSDKESSLEFIQS